MLSLHDKEHENVYAASVRAANTIEKKQKGEGQKQQSHYPLSDETGYGYATIRLLNVDAPSLA